MTPPRVEGALAGLEGRSARTVNYARGALSSFFAWLVKSGRWPDNPCKRVGTVRQGEPARRRRALHPEELARLLDAAPADRALVYLVAATCGLRRGELRALRPADLDLEAGTVTVRAGSA